MTPQDKDIEKLKWLLQKLTTAEDYCRPYFERAKRHYRLYRFGSAINEEDWPYVNRVRTRDILAFVEDSTAIMVQTLLGTLPFFSVIPRQTSQMMMQYTGIDPVKIGRQMEACLDQQLTHEDAEFFEEITDFFKEGCIYGTSYIGVYPRFSGNRYVGPLLKAVDFWNVLPITGARRISKARGVFIREFMSKEEAEELANKYGLEGATEQLRGFLSGTDPERKWHSDLLAELGIENYSTEDDDVEIIHYFSGGHVISFVDRAIIIRDSNEPMENQLGEQQVVKPFPYDQPVVQYRFMPVPMEIFGMGIPEVLEVLQEDKNLIRSARRDNIDLIINKVQKARAGADINYDLIRHYPGAIWPLENLTDLETVEQGDVTQSSYQEESVVANDMENALSFFGYARGMTPTHEEKPTTVIRLQNAAMNRLDLAVKLAEFGVLQNIATRVILLTRRFMKQQEYEAIIGDQDAGFYRMSEEDIRKFYLIKPMGSSVTHVKEIRQQQLNQAAIILEKVAPAAMSNMEPFDINWYQAARMGLEQNDIKNIDQLLVKIPPEQAQQMVQQQQMAQLQQVAYGVKTETEGKIAVERVKTEGDVLVERVKQQKKEEKK
jgi:hypothetical protein